MHYIVYLFFFIALALAQQKSIAYVDVITNPHRSDGFGAQFQTIIYSVIYAELTAKKYVYTPFKRMEHNYQNDLDFITKKEWLINFIDNFEINRGDLVVNSMEIAQLVQFFDANLIECVNSFSIEKIKKIFRSNKNTNNYFNKEHLNIGIHMRRPNPHDSRLEGTDTPDDVFLNIINKLRFAFSSKNPLFHIYSQGNSENFKEFNAQDIILHLNESIEDSFAAMVFADVLVTSRSSFSYTAGLLSDGIIYYIPFWCTPLPHWVSVNELLK